MKDFPTLAVIPARGGSKGIPRKNVRFLAGQPLIRYAIRNALGCPHIDAVVVSTDDDEIAHVADLAGARVVRRPAELARDEVPLDPVIHHTVRVLEEEQGQAFALVVTIQPTSPLLASVTMARALERFVETEADTLLSAVDDRHLAWTREGDAFKPLYQARVNRQYLPSNFRETGGIVVTRRAFVTPTSRFGPRVDLFEVSAREGIDIDTRMDWWIAEKLLTQKRILMRVDGYSAIGLGHIYRVLLLASRLIDHELLLVSRAEHALGVDMLAGSFFPLATFSTDAEYEQILDSFGPDIVVNDILDTSAEEVQRLQRRGIFVVHFEDLGPGARLADVVINALYEEKLPFDNIHWSKTYYCLRDEFLLLAPKVITERVDNVLLTFGGTDANDFTARVLKLLSGLGRAFTVTVVAGLGYAHFDRLAELAAASPVPVQILRDVKTISRHMYHADIIFTSAGRTVYEIASMGTPVIVLAQNNRELHHTFAHSDNGVINLGLGTEVDDSEICDTFLTLVDNLALRQKCNALMLKNDLRRGMDKVLELIFSEFEQRRQRHL